MAKASTRVRIGPCPRCFKFRKIDIRTNWQSAPRWLRLPSLFLRRITAGRIAPLSRIVVEGNAGWIQKRKQVVLMPTQTLDKPTGIDGLPLLSQHILQTVCSRHPTFPVASIVHLPTGTHSRIASVPSKRARLSLPLWVGRYKRLRVG